MTRGIQLKQLSAADLGHLGIPPDLLGDPDAWFGEPAGDLYPGDEPDDGLPFTMSGDEDPDLRALAHDLRAGLEETLALLTAALPAEHRPRPTSAAVRAD